MNLMESPALGRGALQHRRGQGCHIHLKWARQGLKPSSAASLPIATPPALQKGSTATILTLLRMSRPRPMTYSSLPKHPRHAQEGRRSCPCCFGPEVNSNNGCVHRADPGTLSNSRRHQTPRRARSTTSLCSEGRL